MLSNEELVSIIDAHRRSSLGDETSDLSNERASAMDRYHGRPYGDEQDGRSQVVSKDVADTVGWLMPAIMKVFVSGKIADFAPTNEEDEEAAQQESDYVNQVIMKDNNGFIVVHDWVKDTLILKNGYVKHWWDEEEVTKEREYEGLNSVELGKLFMELESEGAEVEVLEQESEMVQVDTPTGPIEIEVFEVKLRTTTKKGRVRIEAVPTEEIRVSKRARDGTQNSGFIEWYTTKTRTELIEMGMDADWVDTLPSKNNEDDDKDRERRARSSTTDEDNTIGTSFDRSMDDIAYSEAYLLVDYDKDGKAELRKVITVADTMIPEGEEWNEVIDRVPITSMVIKRVPHRHIGESIDDDLSDLQRIKTVLMRGMLDNTYFINNSEIIVNELAHLPDFVQSLPGGVKRIKTELPIAGMTQPLVKAPMIDQLLPAIDYIDRVKDDRSGINELTTNVDSSVLKSANNAAFMEGVDRAAQKVEMIIRMVAETGIKELVLRVHELLLKHQDKPRMVKLRGKYVSVNPTEWRDRTDLTVSVGIGTGSEEQRRQKLGLVNTLQQSLMQLGLVTPAKAYNLFDDTLETLGMKAAGRYALDPDSEEYAQYVQQQQQQAQQQQPNPLAEAEMVKAQAKIETDQLAAQVEMMLQKQAEQHESAMMQFKAEVESREKEADRLSKEAIEAGKLEVNALIEGIKLDIGKTGVGADIQGEV